MERKYFTLESVTEGHSDKMCDAILDALMEKILCFWLNFYSKVAGPLFASGIIFLSLAAAQKTKLNRFSPVSWIRLDSHYRILNPEQPSVGYILTMLILWTILFLLLARFRALETQENNRRKG